jgi:hypothetical protein
MWIIQMFYSCDLYNMSYNFPIVKPKISTPQNPTMKKQFDFLFLNFLWVWWIISQKNSTIPEYWLYVGTPQKAVVPVIKMAILNMRKIIEVLVY